MAEDVSAAAAATGPSPSKKRVMEGTAPVGGYPRYARVAPSPYLLHKRIALPTNNINDGNTTHTFNIKSSVNQMLR